MNVLIIIYLIISVLYFVYGCLAIFGLSLFMQALGADSKTYGSRLWLFCCLILGAALWPLALVYGTIFRR